MQKNIINAFLNNEVKGYLGGKSNHIETVISNVFVGNDFVYKIYKDDSKFFNENFYDLSNKKNRVSFTTDDFNWNHALSPEVYLELKGVSIETGEVEIVDDIDSVQELVIIMKKLDMNQGIFMRLMRGDLKQNDFYQIGFQLAEREKRLTPNTTSQLNLYDDFNKRYPDVKNWIAEADKYIPLEEREVYLLFLRSFIDKYKEDLKTADEYIGIGMDFHSENGVYENGVLLPIDTYPPKAEWRAGHRHINVYRVATDAFALSGEESFRSVLRGYEESNKEKFDKTYERFFITYAAVIMVPYFYMLGEKDALRKKAAERYQTFLKDCHNI